MNDYTISYTLDSDELALLLAALGMKTFYGFDLGCAMEPDRETVLRCVHHLFNRQLLFSENGRDELTIVKDLKELLLNGIKARKMIRVLPEEAGPPLCCYCCGDAITVFEPDLVKKNGWRVRAEGIQTLIAGLKERDLLPSRHDSEMQSIQESMPAYWGAREEMHSIASNDEPLLRMELINLDDTEDVTILCLVAGSVDYEMIVTTVVEEEVWPYSEQRLLSILTDWMKEVSL